MPLPGSGLVAVFALFLSLQGGAHGSDRPELSEIERVGEGITPGIATDAGGTVHLILMQDGMIFHRRKPHGGKFEPAETLPLPEGKAAYNSPHVVCDAAGVVHMVFERDFTGASRKAWYTNRSGGVWKQPVLAIESTAPDKRVNYPRLALAEGVAFVSAFTARGSVIVKLVGLEAVPTLAGRIDTPLWVAHVFPRGIDVLVVGRAGGNGHQLHRYDAALARRGEPVLLSRGTPTKTGEATAAAMDRAGTILVAGSSGHPTQHLWGTTDRRAAAGANVVAGLELGREIKEHTYPVMTIDRAGRAYVSYRDHVTGEGRITVFDVAAEGFSAPVTFAPATTKRLRWNPQTAPAREGGVHVAWDENGQIYTRTVRIPRAGVARN